MIKKKRHVWEQSQQLLLDNNLKKLTIRSILECREDYRELGGIKNYMACWRIFWERIGLFTYVACFLDRSNNYLEA